MTYKIKIYKSNEFKIPLKVFDEFKEVVKHGVGCELFTSESSYIIRITEMLPIRYLLVDPENECGKIIDIDEDFVTVKITNKNINIEKFEDLLDKGKTMAYMRASGYKRDTVTEVFRILTFDLVIGA